MPRPTRTDRPRTARKPAQLGFRLRTWGGARARAGRKKDRARSLLGHLPRPALASRFPVHVTLRVEPHVYNLRSRRSFRVIGAALAAAADRFATRICEFSIQGNHLHLVVESADRTALARSMKGLGVRLARGLNQLMNRKGRVIADRYHAHILRTPTEVRHALDYVRHNCRRHATRRGEHTHPAYVDPYSSASHRHGIALGIARTWLLCRAPVAAAGRPPPGG